MSLGIPPELRQAGSYLFARRISPDKRISSVLDFLTRCRLPGTDPHAAILDYFRIADKPGVNSSMTFAVRGRVFLPLAFL
jgi:hypothetical protein